MMATFSCHKMSSDKLKQKISHSSNECSNELMEDDLPVQFKFVNDKFLVTNDSNRFPFVREKGLLIELETHHLKRALAYFFQKASLEVKTFMNKKSYVNISEEKDDILMYTGRILPSQKIDNQRHLADVCLDLSMDSFCVSLMKGQ